MSVQFRRKKGMGDEISTASMSDIAFLLLIFFLVTTIFAQDNILNIEVNAQNIVYLDGTRFQVSGIEREVRRRLAGNDKLIIQLKVHPDAFYGTMVDVLDELQLAEARKISIKGMDVV